MLECWRPNNEQLFISVGMIFHRGESFHFWMKKTPRKLNGKSLLLIFADYFVEAEKSDDGWRSKTKQQDLREKKKKCQGYANLLVRA